MKAAVSHITAASSRRVVIVINVQVEPGTAGETAEAIKGWKLAIGEGLTDALAELVKASQERQAAEKAREARAVAPCACPDSGRPTLGALVRHVLADTATIARRDLLAGVVSVAAERGEWFGIAVAFSGASRDPNEHPDNARDLEFCHRAACAMADGDEQRAAQELAAMDGIDLNSWAEAIEEEIAEDGARGAS
jgi:hypothetical protein